MAAAADYPVERVDPPALEFYSKRIRAHGVTIRAPDPVYDETLRGVAAKLGMLLADMGPEVADRLAKAGVTMSVYARDQRPSDLPENAERSKKPVDIYDQKNRPSWAPSRRLPLDQAVAGQVDGAQAFCPEVDPGWGGEDTQDVCLHEWAHVIHIHALGELERSALEYRFQETQVSRHWEDTYASVDPFEFFAVASVRFFGGQGGHQGFPPEAFAAEETGPEWLAWYDPTTHEMLEAIYQRKDFGARLLDLGASSEWRPVLESSQAALEEGDHAGAWSEARIAYRWSRTLPWHLRELAGTSKEREYRMEVAIQALELMERAARKAGRVRVAAKVAARRRQVAARLAEASARGPTPTE